MIYTSQKWNKNIIRLINESTCANGLYRISEAHIRKINLNQILLQSLIEQVHNNERLNKIDNQVVIN